MTVFLCALPQEARHLRKLSIVKNGNARLICSGVGPQNAARAMRELVATAKPSRVISTGVAGALSAGLGVGDMVVASEVVDPESETRFPCVVPSGIRYPACRIVSASRMITSAEEKQSLAAKFGAVAVDMESAAIARVCAEQGIPFAAVRAISDTADEALPEAVARFFRSDGRLQPITVVAEVLKEPSLLKQLRRLQSQTATACESLRRFFETNPL